MNREYRKKLGYVIAIVLIVLGVSFTLWGAFAIVAGGKSGEFKGVYTFKDDTTGQAPAGLTLNEGIGEKYTVVSKYTAQSAYTGENTHTKVLQLQHTKFMQEGYVQGTFATPPSGDNNIFEFWMCNPGSCGDNQELDVWLVNSTGNHRMWMQIDCQDIALWHSGGATTLHDQYTRNKWHHFRIELDMASNQYTVTRDETVAIGGTFNFANSGDITGFRFATAPWYDNPNDGTYNVYVDAVGYNWTSSYAMGDNLDLIENANPPENAVLLILGIIFLVIGIITLAITIRASRKALSPPPVAKTSGAIVETVKRGDLQYCPHCGGVLLPEVIRNYKAGKHVCCPICDIELL